MAENKDADAVTQDKSKTPAPTQTNTEPKSASKPSDKPASKSWAAHKTPDVSKPADRAVKAKNTASSPPAKTQSNSQGLLWLMWLLLLAAVLGLGYVQWQTQDQYAAMSNDQTGQSANLQRWQQEQQALAQQVADLASAQQTSQASQAVSRQQRGDLIQQIALMDAALVKSMQSMAKEQLDQGLVLPQWQLAEAEYLLRLANQRLAMEQASSSAIALLQAADIIVRDSEQVGTYAVRRAIAADLAALTMVPSVDVEGVYAQLAALTSQASQLSFIPPRTEVVPVKVAATTPTVQTQPTADQQSASWSQIAWQTTKDVSTGVWSELKQLVKVQSRTQADQQLLTPAAELLVRMRIEMALSQTQVALLRRQQTIYDQSLAGVQQLLQQYYRANDPVALAMQDKIARLADLKVLATMPNISGSLNALQSFIATLHNTPTVSAAQE